MSSSAATKTAFGEQALVLWTRHWAIHQLSPFLNIMLGITGGAIDNWPLHGSLDWWHWHLRLPVVVVAMIVPSHVLSFAAHLLNLGFLACTMPFVWDHMIWASLPEVAFVVSMLTHRFIHSAPDFLAATRFQTIISYCCAAFWKCNTAFLDPTRSCATLLAAELLSILPEQISSPDGLPAEMMLRAAPLLTIVGEFLIPLMLSCCPHLGVLLGLGFHLTILMLPVNAAGGFSIACATSYFAFVPNGLVMVWERLSNSFGSAAAVGAAISVAFTILRGTADATFAIFITFMVLLALAVVLERLHPTVEMEGRLLNLKLQIVVAFISLCHGLLGPVLGVQQMAALTMYGNLQHWGGSNHLLAPTSILQQVFADASAETFLGAFAGGIVRVDSTNLPADVLRTPADATQLIPPHVRELLKTVGNAGLFYVPYYARMSANDFFEDVDNVSSTGAGGGVSWQMQPFAAPALEVRRVLALARKRGHPFMLRYTVLPRELHNPTQWMRHEGPQVLLQEHPAEGHTSCIVGKDEPCASSELAMLLPPPVWLAWLLLQYPVPLSVSNDTGLLCIV